MSTINPEPDARAQIMNSIAKKSKFTEKDVEELDHKIKAGLLKRFL